MNSLKIFLSNITNMIDICTFSDYVGILGVAIILIAYVMLQIEYLSTKDFSYSFMNLIGSVLLLYSLFYHWNLASVVIEIMWMIISVYGMGKTFSKRKRR